MNLYDSSRRATARAVVNVARALPRLHTAAFAAAARRRRALILIYHRVSDRESLVVPVVTRATLANHLEALRQVADLVPLTDLTSRENASRVRVAVTFDDDDPAHVDAALPVLKRLEVPATFFLSGRSLHRLPPYWWEVLDHAIRTRGLDVVARALGMNGTPAQLALACENTPWMADRLNTLDVSDADLPLGAGGIRTLASAGMTIGFHTLRHPVLPSLDDAALDQALAEGRRELEDAAGVPVALIAYPFGRADIRVSRAARRAGFVAGLASGGRAVTPASDRFLLPRWEPGPIAPSQLLAQALVRLHVS